MPQASESSQSVPCIKCGYDLRATSLGATCPECGMPAVRSKLGYRVEGEYLVVSRSVKLPRRCALTDPDTLPPIGPGIGGRIRRWCRILWPSEYTLVVPSRRVRWSVWGVVLGLIALLALGPLVLGENEGRLMIVGLLVLPIVGIAALAKLEPRCKVAIGISVGSQLRHAAFGAMVIAGCFFVGLLVSLAMLSMIEPWTDDHGIWGFGIFVGIVLTIISLNWLGPIFRAAKHVDGEFWITGCGKAYLRYCEAERARAFAEAGATDAATRDAAAGAAVSSSARLASEFQRGTSE